MLWRRDEDWFYELFPLNSPIEEFGAYSSFIGLWRSKWDGNNLPKWKDFELNDFTEWWGWISVYDAVENDPYAFRVRLWGTKIAQLSDCDYTGSLLKLDPDTKTIDARHITRTDLEAHREAINTKQISYFHGPIRMDLNGLGILHVLGVPLADDGNNIDKLMYVAWADQTSPET